MPAIKLKKVAAEHRAEKEREEREKGAEQAKVADKSKAKDPSISMLRGLDGNILLEKRKRFIPPAESKLTEWLDTNLESKEECRVSLQALYELYTEKCMLDGSNVVDFTVFNRRIADKFGKTFGLKEQSAYKGLLKEKKAKKKSAIKADSLRLKMKDIIEEALKEAGNPAKGVRFLSIKHYIACNYPALRVDLRPGILRVALERGIRYGHIKLVKGIGFCGFYRLPTDEEPDEKTEEKTEGDDKDEKKDETAEKNGDAEEEKEGESSKPKKSRKRKVTEETAESEEKPKKKKKPKKKSPLRRVSHSSPRRIEDTFPLAMTYMSEPKEASVSKIKKYFQDYYPHVNLDTRLKPALEKGVDKGFWEQVTGAGASGTFRLMIDEFNPQRTDSIDDMICSALIACTEPKQASANLLKKYVTEYHADFNIEARPHLFKHALERAVNKEVILQLSGIGATGSFQLWTAFTPSPAMLAGDEEEGSEAGEDEVYVVRKTKSRSGSKSKKASTKPTEEEPEPKAAPKKRAPPTDRTKARVSQKANRRQRAKQRKSR